jgi:hypothetical protein
MVGEPSAFTGRAVSDNVGNSKASRESTPRAQSLSEGALSGNTDERIGMITSDCRFPERPANRDESRVSPAPLLP